MKSVSVLIAGGGPVGMTLANVLAHFGIRSMVVERNTTTTRHPKMDITNSRSMELFRRFHLSEALRNVAVPEDHSFDVSWITSLAGYELHRFRYMAPSEFRKHIRIKNDGTQPLEPPMRVSQVEIEPVLKKSIDARPEVLDLAALAVETGYADQAHLTRECARLSGLTPAALARQRAG